MRILVAAGYTDSLINFRCELLMEMLARGHEVHACGAEPDGDGRLAGLGVEFHRIPMNRQSANPASDLSLINRYKNLMREVKPDIALCYTIKPNVYAAPEAKKAGARVLTMVTGLGNSFVPGGLKRRLVLSAVKRLYRRSAAASDRIIFQNPDDLQDFIGAGILSPKQRDQKAALVNGSGVNMQYYTPAPVQDKPIFLMAARLLREKGVVEYIEAARMLKSTCPEAEFRLAGAYEDAGFALKPEDLQPYIDDGSIHYLGELADVRPQYEASMVYVLPSYREGTPRTVLEAMACGRAVITSDAPGCRETVIPGKTGLLVEVGNPIKLAEAMRSFIEKPAAAADMGHAGLEYCRDKYEVGAVNKQMLNIMGLT
ncbi:MAG: glycosyltransferase family 4 protein [Clostridiales Family XIII bacterium]|jgi:glycosyltransferase involved in cell wall biosynthesis|nr:glycosyltransferase family 4 protein [Clostridiales Family XIII bacterium]